MLVISAKLKQISMYNKLNQVYKNRLLCPCLKNMLTSRTNRNITWECAFHSMSMFNTTHNASVMHRGMWSHVMLRIILKKTSQASFNFKKSLINHHFCHFDMFKSFMNSNAYEFKKIHLRIEIALKRVSQTVTALWSHQFSQNKFLFL